MTFFYKSPCVETPCRITQQLQSRLHGIEEKLATSHHSTGRNMDDLYSYVRDVREAKVQLQTLDDALADERVKHIEERDSLERCIQRLKQETADLDNIRRKHELELQHASSLTRDMRMSDQALCAAVNENDQLRKELMHHQRDSQSKHEVMRENLDKRVETHRQDTERWMSRFNAAIEDNDDREALLSEVKQKLATTQVACGELEERLTVSKQMQEKVTVELRSQMAAQREMQENMRGHLNIEAEHFKMDREKLLEEIRTNSEQTKDLKLQLLDVTRQLESSREELKTSLIRNESWKLEATTNNDEMMNYRQELDSANHKLQNAAIQMQRMKNERELLASDMYKQQSDQDRLAVEWEASKAKLMASNTSLADELMAKKKNLQEVLRQEADMKLTLNQDIKALETDLKAEKLEHERTVLYLNEQNHQFSVEIKQQIHEKSSLEQQKNEEASQMKEEILEVTRKLHEQSTEVTSLSRQTAVTQEKLDVQASEALRERQKRQDTELEIVGVNKNLKTAEDDLDNLRYKLMESEMRERSFQRQKAELEHQLAMVELRYDRSIKRQQEKLGNLQYESCQVNKLIDETRGLARQFPAVASKLLAHVNRLQMHADELNGSFIKPSYSEASYPDHPKVYQSPDHPKVRFTDTKEVGELSYQSAFSTMPPTSPQPNNSLTFSHSPYRMSPPKFSMIESLI